MEETKRETERIKRNRNLEPTPTNKTVPIEGFLKLFKKNKPKASAPPTQLVSAPEPSKAQRTDSTESEPASDMYVLFICLLPFLFANCHERLSPQPAHSSQPSSPLAHKDVRDLDVNLDLEDEPFASHDQQEEAQRKMQQRAAERQQAKELEAERQRKQDAERAAADKKRRQEWHKKFSCGLQPPESGATPGGGDNDDDVDIDLEVEFDLPPPATDASTLQKKSPRPLVIPNGLRTQLQLSGKPVPRMDQESLQKRLAGFGLTATPRRFAKPTKAVATKASPVGESAADILARQRNQIRRERELRMEQIKDFMKIPETSREKEMRKEIDREIENEMLMRKAERSAQQIQKQIALKEQEATNDDEEEEGEIVDDVVYSDEEIDISDGELIERDEGDDEDEGSEEEDEEDEDEPLEDYEEREEKISSSLARSKSRKVRAVLDDEDDEDSGVSATLKIPDVTQVIPSQTQPVTSLQFSDTTQAVASETQPASSHLVGATQVIIPAATEPDAESTQDSISFVPNTQLSQTQHISGTPGQIAIGITQIIADSAPDHTIIPATQPTHDDDFAFNELPGSQTANGHGLFSHISQRKTVAFLDHVEEDFPDPTQISQIPPATPLSPPRKLNSATTFMGNIPEDSEASSDEERKKGVSIPNAFLRRLRQKQHLFGDEDGDVDVEAPTQDDNSSTPATTRPKPSPFGSLMRDTTSSSSSTKKSKPPKEKSALVAEILDEEAVESEDEWAGAGGASDDEGRHANEEAEQAEINKVLINDNDETVLKMGQSKMEADNLALLAEKQRLADESATKELLEMTTGEWRKRGGRHGLFGELSDDEDDYDEFLDDESRRALFIKRRQQQEEAIKRKLMASKDSSFLVSDPKASAFLQDMVDVGPKNFMDAETRAMFGDFEEASQTPDSGDDPIHDSKEQSIVAGKLDSQSDDNSQQPGGPSKRKAEDGDEAFDEDEDSQWAIMKRRKQDAQKRRKFDLDMVRQQLSFLQDAHGSPVPEAAVPDNNDAQSDIEMEFSFENDEEAAVLAVASVADVVREKVQILEDSLEDFDDLDNLDNVWAAESSTTSTIAAVKADAAALVSRTTLSKGSVASRMSSLLAGKKPSPRASIDESEDTQFFGVLATRSSTATRFRKSSSSIFNSNTPPLAEEDELSLEPSDTTVAKPTGRQTVNVTVGLPAEVSGAASISRASINYQKKPRPAGGIGLSRKAGSAAKNNSAKTMMKNGSAIQRVDPAASAAAALDRKILERLKSSSRLTSMGGSWS